jgi:hypothetical protein
MPGYALIGHMGAGDVAADLEGRWHAQYRLDLLGGNRTLRYGMGGAIRTLGRLDVYPSEVGVDVLVLAAMVHAADTRINRVQTSQDAWTRELGISVPVSDPDLWVGQRALVEKMLRFLTGDHWTVAFRPRPEGLTDFVRRPVEGLQEHIFDGVALFSGGLDSLIGAIDRLEEGSFPLFVSHGGEGAVSKPQKDLFLDVAAAFREGNREPRRLRLGMTFTDQVASGVGREETTRGRSFLFIALAAMAGSGLGRHFSLEVPENGLIALNVPLDTIRLGSLSTRTTHPYYLRRWNELLSQVGIDGTIVNRYWNKTKGEMMDGCLNPDLLHASTPASPSPARILRRADGTSRRPAANPIAATAYRASSARPHSYAHGAGVRIPRAIASTSIGTGSALRPRKASRFGRSNTPSHVSETAPISLASSSTNPDRCLRISTDSMAWRTCTCGAFRRSANCCVTSRRSPRPPKPR